MTDPFRSRSAPDGAEVRVFSRSPAPEAAGAAIEPARHPKMLLRIEDRAGSACRATLADPQRQHWHWLPLDPDVVDELRVSVRQLQPELDDHVFTAEVEQWVSAYDRERHRKDPKQPASDQALMRMVWRVSQAGGRSAALASPAAARLRQSLPARERPRLRSHFKR